MNIKKIPQEAQTLISASAYINNFTRAIEELVYNSLDAECSSIAIRVSIQESFIQILDNGIGICKENFCLLGQKYATSKHIDVTTLKSAPDKYGFRGLSLATIVEISQDVLISSRYHESDGTWLKTFHNGTKKEFCVAPARPSKGTTVEIRGFLYNLNILKKSIDNLHELQKIKSSLEQLSLIHCNVSISLRDDYKNEIIFKIHKKRDIYQTLWSLFEINREDVQELQVEKNQYKVKAFISKGNIVKQNQWIYLNGKFVSKTDIHKKVNKIFKKLLFKHNKITKIKNKSNDDYSKSDLPFYFIFISCPFYDFDIIYKNKQTLVEFKDWTEIDKLVEKLIQFYCGESNLKVQVKEKKSKIENTRMQVKEIIEKILNNNGKQSSVQHGIKGNNIKRKNKNNLKQIDINIPLKSQKPKKNFKVLKEKQDLQNIIKKYCTKKEIMKPTLKDVNKIKYKNKTLNKQMKRIRNGDGLINKFKNQTDSVKKRCAKLSSEAQIMRNVAPKNKILKFSYTTAYNETVSYCNDKEVALDTYYVSTESKYTDNNIRNNNFDFVNPKTSYDLIKPFNQCDRECLTIPEHTEIQCTQVSHSERYVSAYVSLHPKNTFDSHSCHSNSKRKKKLKHFISTSSCQNFLLLNKNFTISHDNYHRTKKSLLNEIYGTNNVDMKQVSDGINENKCDQGTEINNSYTHNYEDCDNYIDKIINISDVDNQSLIKSDFGETYDIDECSLENAQNKTYSVHVFNNLSENSSIQLSSIDKEPFLIEQSIEHVQSNTKSTIIESPSNVKYFLSKSIDPLSYCEIIFKSNEMDDITKEPLNSFTSNCKNNYSFDYKLLDDRNNEILEENCIENAQDRECGTKEMNVTLNDIEIGKFKILMRNNLPQDVNNFQLKKRHEFMPKGMSQIYKTRIRKNYDLANTKIDYYENIVYNNFADDVLLNSEIFSPMLENIDFKSKKFENTNHKNDSNLIFNTSSLKEAKVFGQIDRKFIATQIKGISSDSSLDFLVLFDQHAVDERIRLETNLADYFDGNIWSGVALESVSLKLDKHDLLYLYNHKLKFLQFGLQWQFLDDRILVNSIPKAILGKNPRQEDVILKAVRRLILEEIDVIKSLGGNVSLYPKAIMDLVFSEACRYAIKFGDKLSKSDCVAMLKLLSTCKTPFQCAHGRPVMAVLIDLPRNIRNYEVNVENIKQFKIRKSI